MIAHGMQHNNGFMLIILSSYQTSNEYGWDWLDIVDTMSLSILLIGQIIYRFIVLEGLQSEQLLI